MSTEERLARLEEREKHVQETLDEVRIDVKDIKAGLNKQRGFIAGIMFIVTPIWGGLLLFAKSIYENFIE